MKNQINIPTIEEFNDQLKPLISLLSEIKGKLDSSFSRTLSDIAHIRLHSQQIAATKIHSAKEMVGWMGAMQAQDYHMAKWALGVRLPNSTDTEIEAAINKG